MKGYLSKAVFVSDNPEGSHAENLQSESINHMKEDNILMFIPVKNFYCYDIEPVNIKARNLSFQSATMPYEKSEFITDCIIDTTVISVPDNVTRPGDNWPVTWSSDDNLYSFFADGYGFTPLNQQYSRYPCKITGSPSGNNIRGYDINTNATGKGTGGDVKGKKVSGLISLPDPSDSSVTLLVAWVRNINTNGGSSLLYSRDFGSSWTWAWGNPDSIPGAFIPELGHPSWMQSGKNNSSAQDNYLYFYSQDQPKAYLLANNVILGRVPKNQVLEKSEYQYFSGTTENPSWTSDIKSRKPAFLADKQCYRLYVTYNPSLERYFLLTANGDGLMTNYEKTHNLGIYESLNPWGPWKTVYWNNAFHTNWSVFGPQMVPKWISNDGKTFYLLYSNFPNGPYKMNIQKVTLKVSDR